MLVGIIGYGFVGRATHILETPTNKFIIYDINKDLCSPKNITLQYFSNCDLIFVCVPTPNSGDGSCYTKIVENVIKDLSKFVNLDNVIIRSTVPPGTSDKLKVNFMPEFLTERGYKKDFINCKSWIFGIKDCKFSNKMKKILTMLIQDAKKAGKINYDNIYFTSTKEAEMIKYFKNCYLSTKVSFCNEIYEFCKKKDINYNNVVKHVTLDDRITSSHTMVPGPDGKFGYGGTCLPKDTHSLLKEMEKNNMKSYILKSVIQRNEEKDRNEKDWLDDHGRAIV